MKTTFLLILMVAMSSVGYSQARRLVFEETVIEGKVQKPEITMFITRQNLNTDYNLELRESFIPKIIKTVDKRPF